MSYTAGSTVRVTNTFKNLAGDPADPTTIRVVITTPAGVATTYTYGTDAEVVRTGVGVYYIDVTLATAGTWRYSWDGDGVADAANTGTLEVNPATKDTTRLVTRLRALVGAEPDAYTLDGTSYWTDEQLQARLDRRRIRNHRLGVEWDVTYSAGSRTYEQGLVWYAGALEGGANIGTLEDEDGATITGYTIDGLQITLDTPLSAEPTYYWSGTSYDIYGAAADVLEEWAAMVKLEFRFAADNQQFDRQQKHAQLLAQAEWYAGQAVPAIA